MRVTPRLQVFLPPLCLSLLLTTGGCGWGGPAEGSYQDFQQRRQNAESTLIELGAKLEKKSYQLGEGWVVDLSGTEIDGRTFEALRALGRIAEADFSNSNLSDAHLQDISDEQISGVFLKVNLSNTDVGDEVLKAIRGSLFLSELNVSGTRVTDGGVMQMQKDRQSDDRIRPEFKTVKVIR